MASGAAANTGEMQPRRGGRPGVKRHPGAGEASSALRQLIFTRSVTAPPSSCQRTAPVNIRKNTGRAALPLRSHIHIAARPLSRNCTANGKHHRRGESNSTRAIFPYSLVKYRSRREPLLSQIFLTASYTVHDENASRTFFLTLSGISEIMASRWIAVQIAPGAEKPPGVLLFRRSGR
jgi:hypothetical protein